jgi:hypothetical protein
MTYLLKKGRADKQLFAWQKKIRRKPAKEKAPRIKKKIAYSKLGVLIQKGGMKSMKMMMSENR